MEPLYVTFAREVLGKDVRRYNELWVFDLPGSLFGWGEIERYDLDRAYCQELAEENLLLMVYGWHGLKWRVKHDRTSGWSEECQQAGSQMGGWSDTWCEAVLRWAIAAKRAGVDVKVPR